MIAEFGSSGYFGSRVRSNFIDNNTYTGIRSNLRSNKKPIYVPVN